MTYLWIGYLLTWSVVLLYAWRLETRARRAGRRLERGGTTAGRASVERDDRGIRDEAGR